MKYKKPICECGGELRTTAVYSCDILYKINKNGKRAKTPTFTPSTEDGEHLECCECSNAYYIELDEKGRYTRGEEYNP